MRTTSIYKANLQPSWEEHHRHAGVFVNLWTYIIFAITYYKDKRFNYTSKKNPKVCFTYGSERSTRAEPSMHAFVDERIQMRIVQLLYNIINVIRLFPNTQM